MDAACFHIYIIMFMGRGKDVCINLCVHMCANLCTIHRCL